MVQAAVADVVCPAVASKGPHGLLRQVLSVLPDKGGRVAVVILNGRQQDVADLAGDRRVVALFQVGVALVHGDAALGQGPDVLHQLPLDGILAQQAAVSVLGVVLEEAHSPGGTVSLLVGAVGG